MTALCVVKQLIQNTSSPRESHCKAGQLPFNGLMKRGLIIVRNCAGAGGLKIAA